MIHALSFVLLSLFCLSSPLPVQAQESFPFLAEIKGNNVNVRAGQNANFARIMQMSEGDEAVVVAREYDWYKIQLPSLAYVYISSKYIQSADNKTGTVIGDRVNVRPVPSVDHAAVGQVSAGQVLSIVEIKDGWAKIVPPAGDTYGWIHEDFLAFKSLTIPEEPMVKVREKETLQAQIPAEEPARSLVAAQPSLMVQGRLKAHGSRQAEEDVYYLLTVDGQPVYFIKGMGHMLDNFVGYKVEFTGALEPDAARHYPCPVISPRSVKLVL